MNGTISIGCSSLIGQTLLPEVLSLYNSQFPNVEIQVQVGSTEQIKAHHRDYHVMITRGNKVMNLSNTHLFNDEHYFIYPKDRKEDVTKLPLLNFKQIQFILIKLNNGITIIWDMIITRRSQLIKLPHVKKCCLVV